MNRKKLMVLALVVGAGAYLWSHRHIFEKDVARDVVADTKFIPRTEKAVVREKARVDQTRAIDSAAAGETVEEGMRPEDVRRILGDPNSIDKSADGGEIWRYDVVGKNIIIRHDQVWAIEPQR
jgi:hypothetical protein